MVLPFWKRKADDEIVITFHDYVLTNIPLKLVTYKHSWLQNKNINVKSVSNTTMYTTAHYNH